MKFSFELKTETSPEKIWARYSDVNNWFTWEDKLESITLDGEFTKGSSGQMKLLGQPTLNFDLVSVIPNVEFIDKTSIPNVGDIYFIHQLIKEGNMTIIRHSVEFLPKERIASLKDTSFLAQIFSDVPAAVFLLIKTANE